MRNSPGRSHTPAKVSASLERHLNFYTLAASAAGVSLLALAGPADAKIIYTKTHQVIRTNGICPIDLNHDGNVDFVIQNYMHSYGLFVQGAVGNAVDGSKEWWVAALRKGAAIGPRQHFISNSSPRGGYMAAPVCSEDGSCWWSGQWINVTNRYLGLRFQIDAKTHYGWARLSTQAQGFQITATLTGYAYETVADKGIGAGQTGGLVRAGAESSDPTASRVPDRANVGSKSHATQAAPLRELALGARGLAFWRRQ